MRQFLKYLIRPWVLALLRFPSGLFWFAYLRYLYLAKFKRTLRTTPGSSHVSANTVQHNLSMLRSDFQSTRSLRLIRPLSVIETVGRLDQVRILAIGPRTEGELLQLWLHGFRKDLTRALDLISYSPWIDVGDMHNMPYPDDSFDMVLMGWTLAYSDRPSVAAQEIVRVAREGGVVAVGVEYATAELTDQVAQKCGYLAGSTKRIRSIQEILDFFADHVDQIYFQHGIVPGINSEFGSLIVIFSVRKNTVRHQGVDSSASPKSELLPPKWSGS